MRHLYDSLRACAKEEEVKAETRFDGTRVDCAYDGNGNITEYVSEDGTAHTNKDMTECVLSKIPFPRNLSAITGGSHSFVPKFFNWFLRCLKCIGVMPMIILSGFSIILLLCRESSESFLQCFYYPWLGPYALLGKAHISFLSCLNVTAIIALPLFFWRIFYKGKDYGAQVVFEIWFAIPWGMLGSCGYMASYSSIW